MVSLIFTRNSLERCFGLGSRIISKQSSFYVQGRGLAQKSAGLREFFDNENGWDYISKGNKRAWRQDELARKSFSDLHYLWWICIKEKNKLLSLKVDCELNRFAFDRLDDLNKVKETMKNINIVLWNRIVDRNKALKILEIVKSKGALKEGERVKLTKEERDEIVYMDMPRHIRRRYKAALNVLEEDEIMEKAKNESNKELFFKI